jgi:hypothetical protein
MYFAQRAEAFSLSSKRQGTGLIGIFDPAECGPIIPK